MPVAAYNSNVAGTGTVTTPLTGNRLAIAGTDEGLASPATQAKPWVPASCETSLFDKGSYSALAFALKVERGKLTWHFQRVLMDNGPDKLVFSIRKFYEMPGSDGNVGRLAVYDTRSVKELWSFEQNVPFLTAVARAGYRAR